VPDDEIRGAGAEPLPFEELLMRSDVLSVHVPLTEETRGLVGRSPLALLPPGAVVVNTARGGLVDEYALAEALGSGRLRGAALDVLVTEPPPGDHPLRALPNLLLTPHAAWYSEEAIVELRCKGVEGGLALGRGPRDLRAAEEGRRDRARPGRRPARRPAAAQRNRRRHGDDAVQATGVVYGRAGRARFPHEHQRQGDPFRRRRRRAAADGAR